MKFKVDMEPTYNNANIFFNKKKSKFKKYSYVFYFVFF